MAVLSAPVYPRSVVLDAAGNLIFNTGSGVFKMDAASGVMTRLAGTTGGPASIGDGGPAAYAQLNLPNGVAADSSNNVYIADSSNHRIRKVTPAGIITTIAGNGAGSFSGDMGPAANAWLNYPMRVLPDSSGNLYISDKGNYRVRKINAAGIMFTVAGTNSSGYSGDGGQAKSAKLNSPTGLALDSAGNLSIADDNNGAIRKVTSA